MPSNSGFRSAKALNNTPVWKLKMEDYGTNIRKAVKDIKDHHFPWIL